MVTGAQGTVLIDADEHASANHLGMSDRARYWVNTHTGQLEERQ